MRTTIPRITLRDETSDPRASAGGAADDEAPASFDGERTSKGIPVIELDSSELEERESAMPDGLHDGLTTSTRQGAIAGPMGPSTPTTPNDDRR